MDITSIVELILSITVTIMALYGVPALMNKFGATKITSAYEIIKILVNAAEQVTKITGAGDAKKRWVIERLASYNMQIDEKKVSELIEAAVLEMNNTIEKQAEINKNKESE
ncbi:MAG: phage holin family protein [Clostridia bacterium]|nr:phage holin family protein [Clostridia bacterium]